MKKIDLQAEAIQGVISFCDGVWILKYQNEFEERAEQKETTPERSMSFLDLKRSVPTAENRRVPTYKRLLQEKQSIIVATCVGNAKITVYQNGYVIYEDGTRRTVMPVHRYGDYHYYFQDGIHVCIPEKEFENLRWELRFLMEGESRIEHNRKNSALRHEAFSLRNDGTDWCSAIMVDFDDEHILRFLADEEWKRLYIAIKRLSRRQKEVVMLYFYKEMDLDEIAEDWGCDVDRIIKILECALIRLRRYFKLEQNNSFVNVNGEK